MNHEYGKQAFILFHVGIEKCGQTKYEKKKVHIALQSLKEDTLYKHFRFFLTYFGQFQALAG